jgi:CubicO group peptidase (beta-lactamase class C family)
LPIKVEVQPEEVGLDGRRLDRIGRHFDSYVDDGRLPGWLAVVARGGRVAYVGLGGRRDVEADLAVEEGTIWRIYSMTKPITSVAAMMLWEEGAFELKDPVANWIPSFADCRVWSGGSDQKPVTVPATEPVRVWHLLTHTSGLTYGFHRAHPLDAMYRAAGYEWGQPQGVDLEAACDAWARLPLLFQPGDEWNYGVSTDVLGRLVEVISGMSLDQFLRRRIFEPLGMDDTAFWVEDGSRGDLAALYVPSPTDGRAVRYDRMGTAALRRPEVLSGGGGLVSTAADYHRFATFLLRGGELDGVRLLGPRTVARMASNHLPGHVDLEFYGRPLFAETTFDGVGFGLGFSVCLDPVAPLTAMSAGEYGWGGAASTAFWVDPALDMTVLFFTQLLPSSTHPIRSQLHQLVHQAVMG